MKFLILGYSLLSKQLSLFISFIDFSHLLPQYLILVLQILYCLVDLFDGDGREHWILHLLQTAHQVHLTFLWELKNQSDRSLFHGTLHEQEQNHFNQINHTSPLGKSVSDFRDNLQRMFLKKIILNSIEIDLVSKG